MRKFENEKLDEIGRRLVRADAVPAREIDRIVGNPALFDSIRTRIASESMIDKRRSWFLAPALASFASLVLVAVAAFAFFSFRPLPTVAVVPPVEVPRTTVPKKSTAPDRVYEPQRKESIDVPQIEHTSTKPPTREIRPRAAAAQPALHNEGDFYAVSYAGDPNETERGGKIIRVDIPRTTLFAMGIDLPLENESETVKADLLVGSDGVTRGIRVVK